MGVEHSAYNTLMLIPVVLIALIVQHTTCNNSSRIDVRLNAFEVQPDKDMTPISQGPVQRHTVQPSPVKHGKAPSPEFPVLILYAYLCIYISHSNPPEEQQKLTAGLQDA